MAINPNDTIMPKYKLKYLKFYQTKVDTTLKMYNSLYGHDIASNDDYIFKYFEYIEEDEPIQLVPEVSIYT